MKFVILAALLAVSAASYNNNNAPGNFGSLAYSNPATSEPNYHTSVNSVNSEPVYSSPAAPAHSEPSYKTSVNSEPVYSTPATSTIVYSTSTLAYSAPEVDNVSPISKPADYATAESDANEDDEEHDEEDEDDDDEETESKNESESTYGKKIKDSGDRNVYATSAVGGQYEHTTASTHVITSAYKEPEYSPTSIPAVVVTTPAYQIPPTTAVPVYVAEEKILPYWLRPGY